MSTRVVILGGGVAGMSAAHELVERGFEVIVLERGDLAGGKARSIPVVDDGEGTSGHQLASGAVGPIEPPAAGRTWISILPGFLQARRRHNAPNAVVRWTQGSGPPDANDPGGIHPVREARFRHTGRLSAHARRRWRRAPRHSADIRANHGPHAGRSGFLRDARLANPDLVQGAQTRRVRTDKLVGLRRR